MLAQILSISRESLILWDPSTNDELPLKALLHARVKGVDSLVISVQVGKEEHANNLALDSTSRALGIYWLRTVYDSDRNYADVGPLFSPAIVGDVENFWAIHAVKNYSGECNRSNCAYLWVGVIALAARHALRVIGSQRSDNSFSRYTLTNWRRTLCYSVKEEAMPEVGATPPSQSVLIPEQRAFSPVVFEQTLSASRMGSLETSGVQPGESFYPPSPKDSAKYPNSRPYHFRSNSLDLGHDIIDLLNTDQSSSSGALTTEHLGLMLKAAAGVRGNSRSQGHIKRWAATAGNLGSVQLFVFIQNSPAIRAGWYLYSGVDHSLVRLDHGRFRQAFSTMNEILGGASLQPITVCFVVSNTEVLSRKYDAFALKLSYLDAGVAVSQLELAALDCRVHFQILAPCECGVLSRAVAFTEATESISAVVTLGDVSIAPTCRLTLKGRDNEGSHPLSYYAGMGLSDLRQVVLQDIASSETNAATPLAGTKKGDGLSVRQATSTGRPSLWQVLAARRSVRTFGRRTLSLDKVSSLLTLSTQNNGPFSFVNEDPSINITVNLLLRRVDGLLPGCYEYNRLTHSLTYLGKVPTADEDIQIFGETRLCDAPLAVWIGGDLTAACQQGGAVGYKSLLMAAGRMANRFWLSGIALSLEGALIAGVKHGMFCAPFRFNNSSHASLIALAIGTRSA